MNPSQSHKTPLFSVTKDDFEWQFFRAGGKGGQKQNKTSSACRCIHPPSGARGESREERQQIQNRRIAFKRCVESKEFQNWVKLTASAMSIGFSNVEKQVDDMMREENLKIEFYDPDEADL